MQYLSVYIVSLRLFKCLIAYAKKSFYRGANAVFGKNDWLASEGHVLQLIKRKCTAILLYGLEPFYLSTTDLRSPDFTINRFFNEIIQYNKHGSYSVMP